MSTLRYRESIVSMLQENCVPSPEDEYTTQAIFSYINGLGENVYEVIHDFDSVFGFILSPHNVEKKLIWEINQGLTKDGKKLFPEIVNMKVSPKTHQSAIRVKGDIIYIGKSLQFRNSFAEMPLEIKSLIDPHRLEMRQKLLQIAQKIYPVRM